MPLAEEHPEFALWWEKNKHTIMHQLDLATWSELVLRQWCAICFNAGLEVRAKQVLDLQNRIDFVREKVQALIKGKKNDTNQ